ncbi:MAG TPA: serine protease [Methylomirabilota bacterium]|nr:serine protease [Methylomirabilota bacterium]
MLVLVRARCGVVGLGVLAAALAGGCGMARPWEPTREDILERILPSAVQVVVEQHEGRRVRTGSGVVIAARRSTQGISCFVLTAGHTVSDGAGQRQTHVVFGRHLAAGTKLPAVVLARRESEAVDLALLRAESDRCVPAPLGHPPVLGESVWVVAFPWGRHLTLAGGIVSQLNGEADASPESASRLMVDASVSYGASGGGVYEARTGGLIGLVEGYRTARVSSQGTSSGWYIDVPVPGQTFVTPLADIRRFLGEVGYAELIGGVPSRARRGEGRSRPEPEAEAR